MSSTIASVSRNSRAADGIRRPRMPEHADREGDVGGHRDAPAGAAVAAGRVEREVEAGRHDHPADRRDDRQGRGPRVAEVAVDQLVLDLQPDDEEEDHHQGVVDPVLQRLVEVERPDVEDEVGVPQRVVRRRPRAVGPHQRDGRGERAAAASRPPRPGGTRAPAARRAGPAAGRSRCRRGRSPRGRRRARASWGSCGREAMGWRILRGGRRPHDRGYTSRADQTSRLT